MRKRVLIISVFFLIFILSGCNYFNVSVANVTNSEEGKISRKSSFWSGFSDKYIAIEEEGQEINFVIDMKEGKVTFVLINSEKEEVYSLTREGECKETITYKVEESGRYILREKGSRFKGSYEIMWSNKADSDSDS